MRITRLIIITCVLFALLVPLQVFAQSEKFYGNVEGTVFNQALRVSGATVKLYTLSASGVQDQLIGTTTTNNNGDFSFPYVAFDTGKQFQYMVRAEKGNNVAIAWVYALDKEGPDVPIYVAPISLDLSIPSQESEVTLTVWSTEGKVTSHSNLEPVPGAKLTLYSYDPASGNKTLLYDNKITDANGQYTFTVPYGMYIARAERSGQYSGEQIFPAYQQSVSPGLFTNLPVPSPTPSPTATPEPTGTSTPGFEAIVALIALLGGALYLRRA